LDNETGESQVSNSGVSGSEIEGAIDAIAVDPNNSAIGFVGSVNGGIWRTDNLNNVDNGGFMHTGHDHWTPQTDQYPSLSINSLAFLPNNSSVLYAGIGDNSSFNSDGGARTGILRSTDGGNTWQVLGGKPAAFPPSPTPAGFAPTGGKLAAGTYYAKYTYTNGGGESTASLESAPFVVAAGSIPTLTVPLLYGGASGVNVYLTNGAPGTETFYGSYTSGGALQLNIAYTPVVRVPPAAPTAPVANAVAPPNPDLAGNGLGNLDVLKVVPTRWNTGGSLNTQIVLAATDEGLFLSQDGGQTWQDESTRPGSGLTSAGVSDLVDAPSVRGNGDVLYAAVPGQGVFKATLATTRLQLPLVWTPVNNGLTGASVPAGYTLGSTNVANTVRIDLAVHDGGDGDEVYAALVESDTARTTQNTSFFFYGLFRSLDQGNSWQSMGVPSDQDGPIDTGGQMNQQGAIAADPNALDVLYIGGDAKAGTHTVANLPNEPDGNLFVGKYNGGTGQTTWQALTGYHPGDTVSGYPHADTRTLVVAGNYLLDGCDGGIYRLDNPSLTNVGLFNHPSWFSLNGNMFTNEIFSVAYDNDNNVLLAGSQDNGTNIQPGEGQLQWTQMDQGGGDGGYVATNQSSSHRRYWYEGDFSANGQITEFSILPITNSTEVFKLNVNGVPLSQYVGSAADPNFTPTSPDGLPFVGPFRLNQGDDSTRLILATNKSLFESFDGGNNANFLQTSPAGGQLGNGQTTALVYGGFFVQANRELIIDGAGSNLWLRTAANQPLVQITSFPGTGIAGETIRGIVADPLDWQSVYVVDSNANVWRTSDITASPPVWNNLTLNLPSLTSDPRSIEEVRGNDGNPYIFIGGGRPAMNGAVPAPGAASGGIYELVTVNGKQTWLKFGANLPNALVTDLHYDSTDDVLVVGTFGRSAYTIHNFAAQVGVPGVIQVTPDNPAGSDAFTLAVDPNNPLMLDISDNGTLEGSIPWTAVGTINVQGGQGTNTLTVDFTAGAFNPPGGINFDGGPVGSPGAGKTLILKDTPKDLKPLAYNPSGGGSGSIVADGATIAFQNLSPVIVNGTPAFTLTTPQSGNSLTLDTPESGQLRVSGSSAGVAFENVTVSSTPIIVLNLASNDAAGETDTVTTTAAALLVVPSTSFTLQTGPTVKNNSLTLDAQGHDILIGRHTITVAGAQALTFDTLGTINLNNAGNVTVNGLATGDALDVNATGTASGSLKLDDGPLVVFNTLTSLHFLANGGDAFLTVQNPTGTIFAPSGGVTFDDIIPTGTLVLGGGAGATFSERVNAGPAAHAGNLVFTGPVGVTYTFTGLFAVHDSVPVGTYKFEGTNGPSLIQLLDSPFTGFDRISDDDFPLFDFQQKPTLVLDDAVSATAQNNLTELSYLSTATGLTAISVHGGNGNDTIRVLNAPVGVATTLYADDGDALIAVRSDLARPLTIYGGAGSDTVYGGAGNDSIVGGPGKNVFRVQGGNAAITSNGQDLIETGDGQVTVFGGPGSETVYGGAGNDTINGDLGFDVIHAGDGNTLVIGGPAGNLIYGGAGNDTLYGGAGNDTLFGGVGPGHLYGDGGVDSLYAGSGTDSIYGGTGQVAIFGGPGANLLDGGSGNSTIVGGTGAETLQAGDGNDELVSGPLTVSMTVGNGNDVLIGGSGTGGTIQAGTGQDVIVGPAGGGATISAQGSSRIWGQGGNNTITGGHGADTIDAGSGGNNLINGNGGNDILIGRAASDMLQAGGTGHSYPNATDPNPIPVYAALTSGIPLGSTLPSDGNDGGRWAEMAGSATGAGLGGLNGDSSQPSIATGASGTYVAWTDRRTGGSAIYVAQYTVAFGWQELAGSAHGAGISGSSGYARDPSVTLDNSGNPIVVWTQTIGSSRDIEVARFDSSANSGLGAWVALGTSLGAGGISQDGHASNAQVVETGSGPVVAWLDSSAGSTNVYVKRFSGGAWSALGLGSASFAGVSNSSVSVQDLALATDGNKVAATWTVPVAGINQVELREFNGTFWQELLGSASGNGLSNSVTDSRLPTLAYSGGSLFAAWQDDSSGYWRIYADRFDGTAWHPANSGAPVDGGFTGSPGADTQPKLAAGGSQLELIWVDDRIQSLTGDTIVLYAKRWDGLEFAEQVPGDASGTGVSDNGGDPQTLALAVDAVGHPFVAWSENGSNGPVIDVRANTFDVRTLYYVNDASTAGDEVCSAPGVLGNSGLTPAQPLPSIMAVLNAYALLPGDVIVVDAGTYTDGLTVPPSDGGFLVVGAAGQVANLQGTIDLSNSLAVTLRGLNLATTVTATGSAGLTLADDDLVGGLTLSGGTGARVVQDTITGAGVVLTGNASGAGVEHDFIHASGQGLTVGSGGATGLLVRDDRIIGGTTGLLLSAAADGNIRGNDITGGTTGLDIEAPFAGLIESNAIHTANVGVAYNAAATLSNNNISSNVTGVSSTVADPAGALGFVGTTTPNQIHNNVTGVQLHGVAMQGQHVYANTTGVTGSGTLGGTDLTHANLIEHNTLGVNITGIIQFSGIAANVKGVAATAGLQVYHDLFYGNTGVALEVAGVGGVRVVDDTFYAPSGDSVRVEAHASGVELENNLFWSSAGYDLYVANDSQSGLASDFNDLYADGTGKLVHWGIDFTDILDWQQDVASYDLHSIGRTVVNPTWAQPRFYGASLSDFRTFGLVVAQRASSPTMDAGNPIIDLAQTSPATNLLADPGFEQGLTGWSTNASATTASANPAPFEGTQYFSAGGTQVGFAQQTVDLVAAGFTAAQLDAQNLYTLFGGRVRSVAATPVDQGILTLTFQDASHNTISTDTVKAQNFTDRWELAGDRILLPAGTRFVTYRFEADRESGIADSSFLDAAFLRLISNTSAPDQGAYADTAAELAQDPATHLALRFPDLYTDWEANRPHAILWNSYDNASHSLVRIDLYQDGPSGATLLTTITPGTPDTGSYLWTPQNSGIAPGTHGLHIVVSLASTPAANDRSTEPFAIPEATNTFYVNDGSTANDDPALGTAIGSVRNTGKTPDQPKPYPNNILRIYSVGPGQTLYVNTGTYNQLAPLVLSNTVGIGDDAGFTFTGPTDPTKVAALAQANPLTIAPAIELNGASFMTIAHLTLSSAQTGLWAHNNSTNLAASYLTASGMSSDGFRIEAGSSSATLSHLTAANNGRNGILVGGSFAGLDHSLATGNAQSGIVLSNPGVAPVVANEASFNGGYGLSVTNSTQTTITLGTVDLSGNGNAATAGGNLVHDNVQGGIFASGPTQVAGNTVDNQSRPGAAGIVLSSGASALNNVVHDNDTGILAYGTATITGNRAYHNNQQGIRVTAASTVSQNVSYSNAIGIEGDALRSASLTNNLVYANNTAGLLISGGNTSVDVVNNTIDQPAGDALHALAATSNLHVRDDILMTQSGSALNVAADSQNGFASDNNLLFTSGGSVGTWQGIVRPSLAAWQAATQQDQDSLSQDPLLVAPSGVDGFLGYAGPSSDGRDDDFHPQSMQGSFQGGSLAPVTSLVTGLPVLPTATLLADASDSPTIDRGASNDTFTNEPAPNGGVVNLGNFGNTAQASLSPSSYLLVLKPDGGEVWIEGQTFPIRWRTQDLSSGGSSSTVTIALLEQSQGSSPVLTIVTTAPNTGEFDWMVPTSLIPAADYLVRITRNDGGNPTDTSNQQFAIAAAKHTYYVNDGTVLPGDWTTSAGNDANDGLSPATPKASIQSVLAAYHLGSHDVIMVDEGVYNLTTNVTITADDSGVTIVGFNDPAHPTLRAVINRGSTASGADDFDLSGGQNVTLDHLVITGAQVGINALANANSTGLTVSNDEIEGNTTYGVYLQATDSNASLTGDFIHDNTKGSGPAGVYVASAAGAHVTSNRFVNNGSINIEGATATNILVADNDSSGSGDGISVNGPGSILQNNRVYDATDADIIGGSGTIVSGNSAWNAPTGIRSYSSTVTGNVVFLGGTGIADQGGSTILNNRVFENSGDGIDASATASGNHVYNNNVGIRVGTPATISNNLVEGNTQFGIIVQSNAASVLNNTVDQPTGTAVRVQSNSHAIQLENNILRAQNGYDISVDPGSETGFTSDYNDLETQGAGILGQWENHDFTTLADWSYEVGLDAHSIVADPQFVNPAGADGIAGFSTQPADPSGAIIDDSSGTGFASSGSFVAKTGAGLGNTYRVSGGYGAVAQATWTFTGLTAGQFYQVALTWPKVASETAFAAFSVQDGTRNPVAFTVDETKVPSDFTDATVPWKLLGTFYVTSGTLTISLAHNLDSNLAVADGVRVQRVAGDGGADDDYHLAAGSLGVDAGDPGSSYINERLPNGDRIDLGRYGNTSEATASPAEAISVLAPTALTKVQAGRTATISWQVSGVTPSTYYPGLVLANNPVSYYRMGEAPGSTSAADSSGHGHAATYSPGGVTLGITPRRGSDGDTAVMLDGASGYVSLPSAGLDNFTGGLTIEFWVYPTTVGTGQRFVDFGNGAGADNILFGRYTNTNGVYFQVYNGSSGGNLVYAPGALQQNVWQHFAATVTSTGFATIYKNGVAIASANINVPRNVARTNDYIGKSNSGDPYSGGAFDEFAVYNQALTAAQIQSRLAAFGTSAIDLLPGGEASLAVPLAAVAPNGQDFTWNVPADLAPGPYSIRITSNDAAHPQGFTSGLFQVAENGHDFYVNDGSTSGDVFTQVIGDNTASGKSPAHPMASLLALIAAYSPGAGDTVHVDAGTYVEYRNVLLTAADTGLTIQGPSTAVALLNRNNQADGTAALQFAGASNVVVDHLAFTGGQYGLEAYNQGGQNLTISNDEVFGNRSDGIEIFGASVGSVTVTGSTIHDNNYGYAGGTGIELNSAGAGCQVLGNTIFDNVRDLEFQSANGLISGNVLFNASYGIEASGQNATITGNVVHDVGQGISVSGIRVENNEVYRSGGSGISVGGGSTAVGNFVHDNAAGISSSNSTVVDGNRIANNTGTGLSAGDTTTARNNTITGNALGLSASGRGTIDHNLVFGNTNGVEVNGGTGTLFLNNTVDQAAGYALYVHGAGNSVTIENNILETAGTYALQITADTESGLRSDFNDLVPTGSAKLGQWEGGDVLTQAAWFYTTAQDAHSISADPLFVNGQSTAFSTVPSGSAQILDDSDPTVTTSGSVSQVTGSGFDNEYLTASGYSVQAQATYTFTGLTPGQYEQVAVTWPTFSHPAAWANVSIQDGNATPVVVTVNQQQLPSDFTDAGASWKSLGIFYESSGTLTVTVAKKVDDAGAFAADAVRIQQIVGDTSLSSNFQLQPGSPAIDGSDPTSVYGNEPWPNGERADIGRYGNTAQATASPYETLQILDPTLTTKVRAGSVTTATWIAAGLDESQWYAATVLADTPIDFYRLSEPAGSTTAGDLSGNGHDATYQGGVVLGQPPRRDDEANTAVQLDGSTGYVALPSAGLANFTGGFTAEFWANPTGSASSAAFFDFGNGPNSDNLLLGRSGNSNDLVFQVYSGGSPGATLVAPGAIELNKWQFFAVTLDEQGHAAIFKNGQLLASGTVNAPRNLSRTKDYVGKSNWANPDFAGLLGDFAVYNKALTPDRILAHADAFGTATVRLLANGGTANPIILATNAPNNLPFTLTVPSGLVPGLYALQVTNNPADSPDAGPSGTNPSATSALFLVGDPGHDYYINDGTVSPGDLTTAPGDDSATGTSPAHPMASLTALLQVYRPGYGDVIHIDAGSYRLSRSVLLDAGLSGVTFQGPSTSTATINRALTTNGATDFELAGAKDVTIDHLTVTGAYNGIQADPNVGSDRLTISNDVVSGEAANGISIGAGNSDARILGNTVRNNPAINQAGIIVSGLRALVQGNLIFGNFDGINVGLNVDDMANAIIVQGNSVHDNSRDGIIAGRATVVTGNTVFNQTNPNPPNTSAHVGVGIYGVDGIIRGNVAYNNGYGIYAGGDTSAHPISGNRVYDNFQAGIGAYDSATILGNSIYSNAVGIATAGGTGVIEDNVIYANTSQGLLINGSTDGRRLFSNNTIDQGVGNAIQVQASSNVRLRNNIVRVQAGYGLYVANDSHTKFSSDNNLFSVGTGAHVGYWGGDANTLAAWQTATGGDGHSVAGDPRFVNPAGADSVLGYSSAGGGYDGGADDNYVLSSDSPAIDAGDSWLTSPTDFLGAPRHDDPSTSNIGSSDYFESDTGSSQFASTGGTSLGLHNKDDASSNSIASYTLPFAFPFYDGSYTSLYVGVNGVLAFGGAVLSDGVNSDARLLGTRAITPFWSDMNTAGTGNDVFVTSSSTQVTFRWNATNKADGATLNFAVTLFSNGQVRFDYGPMSSTHLAPTIGVSYGNGQIGRFSTYDGQSSLGGVDSSLWTLQPGYVDIGAYEFQGNSSDTTRPTITATTPAQIAAGTITDDSLNQLTLTFSKAVNTIDALAPASYQLLYAGPDGVLGTGDDVSYALNPQSYDATNHVVTLAPAVSGDALPAGLYRLTVFSSGGRTIHDVSGNALDGGSGGDYVRTFSLTPKVRMLQFTTDGATTATLKYEVIHTAGAPFNINVYDSAATTYDATATLLQSIVSTAPADLSPGVHTNVYTIGAQAGQLALPGVAPSGSGSELSTDYNLLVVADPTHSLGAITFADGSNTALFSGAYTASGGLFVHGTPGNDVISVAANGTSLILTLNGTAYTYASGVASAVHLRSHAGDDAVNAGSAAVPLAAWGGAGNDTVTGGAGDDTITGGAGNNTIDGGPGSNTVVESGDGNFTLTDTSLTGPAINDSLANIRLAGLTGGASNNTFTVTGWHGGGGLVGGGGTDTVVAVRDTDFSLGDGQFLTNDGLTLALSGVRRAQLTGGASDNVFSVDGWTGSASLTGGGGNDTISAAKDKNFTLTNSALMSGDFMSVTLAGFATANLTGGPSNNTFTVSGWTGGGILTGGGGVATVLATKNADFTLSDTALTANDGLHLTLSGVGKAQLTGGIGNNTFTVSGWTGGGALTGGGGSDTLVVAKDTNMTLSDTGLRADDHLSMTLSGFATANLTGGPSNNTFTVGGWTGKGTLTGGGGTDTVAATKDKNFTLSRTNLFGGDNMVLNLSGITVANLAGGPSNTTFTVSAWSGHGSINGGGGTDTIVATKDADFTLSNTGLVASDGLSLSLASVGIAKLTGGSSNNTFTVSGWTGGGVLTGGGGSDTIAATKDQNFTLANNSLISGDLMSLVLSGFATANLTGGPSSDTFTVSGWTGGGTLDGGGGSATVLASKNADFTLTNSSLTASDHMALNLVRMKLGRLFGGAGNNTFDVTGWSGLGSLTGNGGSDVVKAAKDFNFTISNTGLRAGDGLALSLGGLATANLTGGPSANTFTVSGWTGAGTLTGGGGTDTVLAVKDTGFTLTDATLTANDGTALSLSGVRKAQLYGGPGNNVFDVTGWTGTGSLSGNGGTDTVVAAKAANFVLSDAGLRDDGDGMVLGLSGITAARLTISGTTGRQISAASFSGRTTLTGGSGNDTLIGGSGGNLLLGGAGDDSLVAGAGRDLLIGGAGADTLIGRGNAILIGGTTSYDSNLAALDVVLAEWSSAEAYATRIAKIKTGAIPGGEKLDGTTIQDDLATNVLKDGTGSTGDWFLVRSRDIVTSQPGEEIDTL
jgi:hypothetical protein